MLCALYTLYSLDQQRNDRSVGEGVLGMDVAALGEVIRANRKAKRLTQRDLADLSGVSDRFLRELEKGKLSAEIGKVMDVLSTLGFELEPILRRSELT